MRALKLAHLSDNHYDGTPLRLDLFRRALEGARERGADHLLVAGDLVDYAHRDHLAEVAALFRETGWWDPERLTVLPGNHDLYWHSAPNLIRSLFSGLPSFAQTTVVFDELFAELMGTRAGAASLPALKQLGPDWSLLLVDTVIRTHRFDLLGSWRGDFRAAQTELTLRAVEAAAPRRLVVAGHHFPMPQSRARTARERGTAFVDSGFQEFVRLLEGIEPRPELYLCGHIHFWPPGEPEAFDTRTVAGVPVYCQGRTGGWIDIEPSWTLHTLGAEGVSSELVPL
jgi:3',5'-cyclic AMP phosphodiesterase CpdA